MHVIAHHLSCALAWQLFVVNSMTFNSRCLHRVNLIIFAQTKATIGNENLIIVPNSSCLNFQVHVTGKHIKISPTL